MRSSSSGGSTPNQPAADWAGCAVRVLIVDDNAQFADLLWSALDTVDGIECVGTASSAAEGFQRVLELDPSVVMMDLMMPGVDGLAATHQLRQLSPHTAVAVVSAHSDPAWIARAQDAGASAYILKGSSLPEMVEVLASARPGPMIVAPSLQGAWSAWTRSAPPPICDPRPTVQTKTTTATSPAGRPKRTRLWW
jgi:DNA-binding NarL/FixJ family response regulator